MVTLCYLLPASNLLGVPWTGWAQTSPEKFVDLQILSLGICRFVLGRNAEYLLLVSVSGCDFRRPGILDNRRAD